MVSEKNKLIYVHISKTAGTSMHRYLKEIGDIKHDTSHRTLKKILDLDPKYQNYRKFSIVRNPWDRILSLYTYHKSRKARDFLLHRNNLEFNNWIKIIYKPEYKHLTHHNLNVQLIHLGNQYDWLTDHGNKICMDFILRFENINKDFDEFTEKFNLPKQKFPHRNQSKHKHYTEIYNNESIDIVSKFCKKDIEYFKYKYE